MLHKTRMSKGSWSSAQVIGMKPQFAGQWTALNSTRSSFIRPLSLSNSYLAWEPVGISIRARTTLGASFPGLTKCQGFLAERTLPFIYVSVIQEIQQKQIRVTTIGLIRYRQTRLIFTRLEILIISFITMQQKTESPLENWTIYNGLISKRVNLASISSQKIVKADQVYLEIHDDAKWNALKYRFPLKYLGKAYKDIVVPCTPAYEISANGNAGKEGEGLMCVVKVPGETKDIGIASGKRSAIYKTSEGKLLRFKGCGNEDKGFNRQKNESRGHHFPHTSKRQLFITTHINKIFNQNLGIDPPANRPLYAFDYPVPQISSLNLVNDLPLISKYCCVFETQGDRRAGTHLISPLEILFLGLAGDGLGLKEVFQGKGRVETNGELVELVANFQLFLGPGQKFMEVYDASKEIDNYITLFDTKIALAQNFQDRISKITQKLAPQQYQEVTRQLLNKIKPQTFLQTCQTMLMRIGYEMGQIKRTMCEHEISWGFYLDHGVEWHCNAHLNNFIVTPPKSKDESPNYFLLPLDYDLSYTSKEFICIDLDSPDYGKNSDQVFQNYLCGEFMAMEMSLFGLEMMNFKYGIDSESEVTEGKKMAKIVFRDTLVHAFNCGMRGRKQFAAQFAEKWEKNIETIKSIVEACLYLSMDFQT